MRMKLLLVVLLAIGFVGCDNKKKEVKFEGVKQQSTDHVSQAMQYLSAQDIPSAIRSFDSAIRNDPSNIGNYMTLGQVYLRLNNPTSAVDTFSAATRVAPDNGEVFYMLAMSLGMQGEKYELAVKAAQRSAELFKTSKNEEKFKESIILLKGLVEQAKKAENAQSQVSSVQ